MHVGTPLDAQDTIKAIGKDKSTDKLFSSTKLSSKW